MYKRIQWETQIRIQNDFDDVLEQSKFIVIPFTVGSTDYGINRNWIANIEENTTTGGTWIYGRFGTPTKRKFSAVEDYETMKNLLLKAMIITVAVFYSTATLFANHNDGVYRLRVGKNFP